MQPLLFTVPRETTFKIIYFCVIDEYFIWAEIGIILGARIGYFVFNVPDNSYYFTHPWEMFNPFVDGKLVGIRGMSYHGAVIGFAIATYLYYKLVCILAIPNILTFLILYFSNLLAD